MSRRCRRHKERRRCSIQILDNFWDRSFEHKVAKKVCRQAPSLCAPTVPRWLLFLCFNNPPFSPFLCVIFLQSSKLRLHTYHFKYLKTHSWCYYFVPDYFVIWSLYTLLPCLFYLIFILSPLISCLPLNQQFCSFTRPFTCKQNLSTCKQNPIFLL